MKAHLISSDEPLKEGKKYYAVCDTEVENAEFRFFFRDDVWEFSLALNNVNTCKQCREAQRYLTGRYVYGVVSAQKLPESERCTEEAVA